MERELLAAIGIRACKDIPVQDLFDPAVDAYAYGLKKGDVRKLQALRAFVERYEREVPVDAGAVITDAAGASALMYQTLRGLDHEEVWMVLLTSANTVIARRMISVGGLDQTIIDKRKIAKTAVLMDASGVILFHNHPSGNPNPSKADIRETESLKGMLDTFGIRLVDHLILTDRSFFSFVDSRTADIDIQDDRQ